jgi:hypothetical protein
MTSLTGLLRGWVHRWRERGTDEYVRWLCSVQGGWLTPGNVRAFDRAVREMPDGGAIVEIGSFLGLSTNILVYLAIKHQRRHPVYSCDPWCFEAAEEPIGGFFDAGSPAFRDYARQVFVLNASTFCGERKPFTVEARSDRFLELWARSADAEDVFGRTVRLGGPVSFAYVDGAHAYDVVRADVAALDPQLMPGGFLFLDDSAEGAGFQGVTRVARETQRNPAYELVFESPNHLFRKRR